VKKRSGPGETKKKLYVFDKAVTVGGGYPGHAKAQMSYGEKRATK